MQSKKRSPISVQSQLKSYRFFIDRNLGCYLLPTQLKKAGFDIAVHDDFYAQEERDPWIFYQEGKKGLIVVTSDKKFMKSFPHMAAIALGLTTVLAFSQNNYNSEVRGRAFIMAQREIFNALEESSGYPFIGSIGMSGGFRVLEKSPSPRRVYCDPRDWESYKKVCHAEGVRKLPEPSKLRSESN